MTAYTMTQSLAMPVPMVEAALETDVAEIYALLAHHASAGNLLPRSVVDIDRHIDAFVVIRDAGNVIGCASLDVFNNELGEVRSLVVADDHGGHGLGASLVTSIEKRAKDLSLRRLMALTYVPTFFARLGFKIVPKESLPEKIWGVCIRCYKFHNCDEIAVLKYLEIN
jgi:amino-acid N-acetyltransferase